MKRKFMIFIILALTFFLSSCENNGTKEESAKMPVISVVEENTSIAQNAKPTEAPHGDEPVYSDYSITMSVNPDTNIITGNVKTIYTNQSDSAMNAVCFNLPLNAFSIDSPYQPYFSSFRQKIFGENKDYGYMSITAAMVNGIDAEFYTDSTVLSVYFPEALSIGKVTEINFQFEAYIPLINHRTGSNKHALWLGGFLPTVSVYEKGNWRLDPYYPAGDPFYTSSANYTVNITTPDNCKVIAAGVESVKEADKTKTVSFTAKLVRDFTFVVVDSSYKVQSVKTNSGININFHYISSDINVTSFLKTAETAVEFFESYVGSYPYSKIEIVETGLFLQGAMEFSQVIFIDSEYLQTQSAHKTLTHEIGHQWFYNIVGSDQVNSAWLDEGLVSYLQEKIYYQDISSFQEKFESDYVNLAEELSQLSILNLNSSLVDYKNWTNYYNIQYTKGKLMIYSLNMRMGEEKFGEFIRTYYSRFSYRIAGTSDFMNLAEEIYGEELDEFFSLWLNEEKLPPLYN